MYRVNDLQISDEIIGIESSSQFSLNDCDHLSCAVAAGAILRIQPSLTGSCEIVKKNQSLWSCS